MKPQDLERLREMLLQMKAESEDDARSSRDATRPVELDQTTVGRLSRMDAMQQQQMAQESARRREHLLQRIDGALRRMDADDYGYCAAVRGTDRARSPVRRPVRDAVHQMRRPALVN